MNSYIQRLLDKAAAIQDTDPLRSVKLARVALRHIAVVRG